MEKILIFYAPFIIVALSIISAFIIGLKDSPVENDE